MQWQDIENDKEKYAAYLCSREWSERREAVRDRAKGMCERCLTLPMNAVHHLTYARKYQEELSDLQAICNDCHKYIHGKSDVDPKKKTSRLYSPRLGSSPRDEFYACMICPVCSSIDNKVDGVQEFLNADGDLVARLLFHCCNGHSFFLAARNNKYGSSDLVIYRTP